jgi:hypothetical protein
MDGLVSTRDPSDPVAAQRVRIGRIVGIAKRIGYLGLLVAMVGFVISAVTGFPTWSVGLTIAGLVVGIVVLPLPIILGYGIRAAEREERGGGRFH